MADSLWHIDRNPPRSIHPFFKGEFSRLHFNPSFVKEGQGRFLARTMQKSFNELQIRHTKFRYLRPPSGRFLKARSSVGERFLDTEEVGSSILPVPTILS